MDLLPTILTVALIGLTTLVTYLLQRGKVDDAIADRHIAMLKSTVDCLEVQLEQRDHVIVSRDELVESLSLRLSECEDRGTEDA